MDVTDSAFIGFLADFQVAEVILSPTFQAPDSKRRFFRTVLPPHPPWALQRGFAEPELEFKV
ncbi:hypothetical protein [Variovorax paradoxus]|uniref:hypothetical protein n=1 Tax=Variovorax paradoxus TaxID=34073 RepID=UPI003D64FFF1